MREYRWEGLSGIIRSLLEKEPGFMDAAVLVGGAACWFYRSLLEEANDPDFRMPPLSPEDESLWLSKDVDYTNLPLERLASLPSELPVGAFQFGVRLGPDDFLETARTVQLDYPDGVSYAILIADPLTLYREKDAAAQKLRRPQDRLHLEALREYLLLELTTLAEREPPDFPAWSQLAHRIKTYAPELLRDRRLDQRLRATNEPRLFIAPLHNQP